MQSFCQVLSSARSGRESSHCNKVLMSVVKRSRKFFEKAPLSFVPFLVRIGTTIHRSQSQMELADEFESLTRVKLLEEDVLSLKFSDPAGSALMVPNRVYCKCI